MRALDLALALLVGNEGHVFKVIVATLIELAELVIFLLVAQGAFSKCFCFDTCNELRSLAYFIRRRCGGKWWGTCGVRRGGQ
jgi:hypothetical protein